MRTSTNQVLPEQSRREYLQAMGVVSWLPKDQSWQPIVSVIEPEQLSEQSLEQLSEREQASTENVDPSMLRPIEESVVQPSEIMNEPIQKQPVSTGEDEEASEPQDHADYPAVGQFLKLVNWSNQMTISNQSKRLLVICRHKVDEPANSFARATAPSQFMHDYITSLVEIMRSRGVEIDVKLAHLSQIGLADDSQPFAQGLKKSKPNLVLILGDETINQFVPNTSSVAELRGKQIKLNGQLNAFVSYHPFTLIQDPSLKRLAFEDLRQLADFFNA
ncbi:MAG: hypothetical protein L3J46_08830 [Kangiellaceae bacterium]|nr:hypothetical protein [Kangiellaceae bacterium]